MKAAIVIPTTNNFPYLVRTIESMRDYTKGDVSLRFIVIDNGSSDETAGYLETRRKEGVPLTVIRNEENVGFIKATNQGLQQVQVGENVVLANDDIQIVDPLWLKKFNDDLESDPSVGIVVPVSNYVMHLQRFDLSFQLPVKHNTNVIVYFCALLRGEAFAKVGLLDERYGIGGHDDLDYSVRLREAGYKLLIDREVFVYHYGSTTLLRNGDQQAYKDLDARTRKIFLEKWGQAKYDDLFAMPSDLVEYQKQHAPKPEEEYGEEYYKRFGHGGYQRNEFWLGEWKRIADEILKRETTKPHTAFDFGCAHGMLVEALRDAGVNACGIDVSPYAIGHAREDIKRHLDVMSILDLRGDDPFHDEDPIALNDLGVCIEVLEHIPEKDASKAVEKICKRSKRVLFSSTPIDTQEPTHKNVKPITYWINLFKQQGFELDSSYDGSFLTPWAMMFVRKNGKDDIFSQGENYATGKGFGPTFVARD